MADKSSLEQLLQPLRHGPNAEMAALLLRMQADDEVQARYENLAERNTEGQLGPAEKEELSLMVRANALLSVLKAEAEKVHRALFPEGVPAGSTPDAKEAIRKYIRKKHADR